VLFGVGFGALDSALNAHAASNFGARDINWMHASYGLGATVGPLVVTAILSGGLTWRWAYGIMAATQAVLTCYFLLARHSWERSPSPPPSSHPAVDEPPPEGAPEPGHGKRPTGLVVGVLTFSAVETGIESGAGIWGYIFLTAGRGLPHDVAGVALAAYWAMMFVGRAVLGPVAERVGPTRVLRAAVGGVALGAALMTVPGPAALAVTGMMILGLAAAPIFPLMTLTAAGRLRITSVARTTQIVSLQVATSAIGAAALPAAMGLAIGAVDARILAPLLLALSLAMWAVYGLLSRLTWRDAV
jgi:fucose permease